VARVFITRAETRLPGLSGHVEVLDVATPQTVRTFTGNPGGAFVGWANTPAQALINRVPQETPIAGLWLAGAWTFPGGGVSAAISSGWMAARAVLASR
jgi:prolycopene isomerase